MNKEKPMNETATRGPFAYYERDGFVEVVCTGGEAPGQIEVSVEDDGLVTVTSSTGRMVHVGDEGDVTIEQPVAVGGQVTANADGSVWVELADRSRVGVLPYGQVRRVPAGPDDEVSDDDD